MLHTHTPKVYKNEGHRRKLGVQNAHKDKRALQTTRPNRMKTKNGIVTMKINLKDFNDGNAKNILVARFVHSPGWCAARENKKTNFGLHSLSFGVSGKNVAQDMYIFRSKP